MPKKKRKKGASAKRRPRTIRSLICRQCGWEWFPRGDSEPKRCPSCRRTTWNRRP